MEFNKSEKHNPNYLATVVSLPTARKHSNADRLQCFSIYGNNCITGLNAKEGDLYVFFPVESRLNPKFLSYTNSFRDKAINRDKTAIGGFFELAGRVKALKLRGERSEGYIIPLDTLLGWIQHELNVSVESPTAGTEFDSFGNLLICEKYKIYRPVARQDNARARRRIARSRIVPNQFAFHYDTLQLKRNLWAWSINPDSHIWITKKLHGTSVVFANILTYRKLRWREHIARFLGCKIDDKVYDFIYSSRSVIKNDREKQHLHYYKEDIWGKAAQEFRDKLNPGISLYGEIVGYVGPTSFIQKGYDYGCRPGEFQTFIYRGTITLPTGEIYEMSVDQLLAYCEDRNIKVVPTLYRGTVRNFKEGSKEEFLAELEKVYLEKDDEACLNKVPAEGICVRINTVTFKLKSFRFLEHESAQLDTGEEDIE